MNTIFLALTGETGRIALVVCWKANLTPKETTYSGSPGASGAVSPMNILGLLLYYEKLCLEVRENEPIGENVIYPDIENTRDLFSYSP